LLDPAPLLTKEPVTAIRVCPAESRDSLPIFDYYEIALYVFGTKYLFKVTRPVRHVTGIAQWSFLLSSFVVVFCASHAGVFGDPGSESRASRAIGTDAQALSIDRQNDPPYLDLSFALSASPSYPRTANRIDLICALI